MKSARPTSSNPCAIGSRRSMKCSLARAPGRALAPSPRSRRRIYRCRMKKVFALLAGLAVSPAFAATPYEIYATGRYDDAMKAGAATGSAAGLTVAARAALADATTRPEPCLDCLRRAEDFASKAVAADPHLADAHVYLAVAMGYEARIVGPVWARAHNYPGRAKDELDAALA